MHRQSSSELGTFPNDLWPRPRFFSSPAHYVPYISCSSIGSTSSSLSELSLSDVDDGLKGSGVYAESGIVLDRRPNGR